MPAPLLELHCFAAISWVISEELSKSSEEFRANPVKNAPSLSDEPLWHPLKMFSRFVEESPRTSIEDWGITEWSFEETLG